MAQDRLEECVWRLHGKGSRHSKAEWEATSRPTANGFLCRGKLWLQERTPEQLKGESDLNNNSHFKACHPDFHQGPSPWLESGEGEIRGISKSKT